MMGEDVNVWELKVHGEISVSSSQFVCKPEIALKKQF